MIHLVIFFNHSTKSPRLRVLESSIHPPLRFPVLFVLQNQSASDVSCGSVPFIHSQCRCPAALSNLPPAAQVQSPSLPMGPGHSNQPRGLPKAKLSSGTVIARHHGWAHWNKLAACQGISVSPGPTLSLQSEAQLPMIRGVVAPTPQTPTPHLLGCPSCIIT